MALLLNEAILNNNEPGRLLPIDIDAIFDIDEESDMDISDQLGAKPDISDSEMDDALDRIMDATDGVGEMWEMQDNDETPQDLHNTEKSNPFHLPADSYEEWIKNLEKAELSYNSVAEKDSSKKSRLAQKESKKCGCKSYIKVMLPVDSTTVTLQHYYKHNNYQPGRLSDLYTLPLSDNICHFISQRALEGLDTHSIQQLLRHRGIELQDRVQLLEQGTEPQNIQSLCDGLVTRDDIYNIVHNTLKLCAYLDNDELESLIKWQEKLNCVEKQKELIKFARVVCLDGTHGLNQHGYHLFMLIIRHPATGKKNSEWNSDIFMVDDAGKEIKAVEECLPDANVLLYHFHVLRSWRRNLNHHRGANKDSHKTIIWKNLWQLMKTEGWDNLEVLKQITEAINKWRRMGVEASTKFANYFERWWKPKYDKWMICLRGVARDMIDTNNLIEAFHRKLKYIYMRGRPKRRLDGEVYLLVEINNIYNISSDTWIVRSMTNADIEYSVRKSNDDDNLNTSLYICTCCDFRVRQLPCKHIFAVLSRFQISEDNIEENDQYDQVQHHVEVNISNSSSTSYTPINYINAEKGEFEKLQEELAAIAAEWKDKNN
ncbi:hypothetical protein C2G38_2229680 [Gigaspora rosea]|uniref:SWIM-type domain-containing protein n=1 Tax=Gigaspora rosea TaxID=44941 RepID=A0A397TVD7_9GLOM|nr:hypothetical protein C2G38_2229680 [Gigaspora rosea]